MRSTFDMPGHQGGMWGAVLDSSDSSDSSDAGDDGPVRQRYRSIFISDLHLGTPGCQAVALLDFLKRHPSDHLYLVGDIVDS